MVNRLCEMKGSQSSIKKEGNALFFTLFLEYPPFFCSFFRVLIFWSLFFEGHILVNIVQNIYECRKIGCLVFWVIAFQKGFFCPFLDLFCSESDLQKRNTKRSFFWQPFLFSHPSWIEHLPVGMQPFKAWNGKFMIIGSDPAVAMLWGRKTCFS